MPVMCLMSCLSAGILIQKISRLDPADGTHATWEDGRRNRVTPQDAKMFFLFDFVCNQPPTGINPPPEARASASCFHPRRSERGFVRAGRPDRKAVVLLRPCRLLVGSRAPRADEAELSRHAPPLGEEPAKLIFSLLYFSKQQKNPVILHIASKR